MFIKNSFSLLTLFWKNNIPVSMQAFASLLLFCIININETLKKEELDAYVDISMEI